MFVSRKLYVDITFSSASSSPLDSSSDPNGVGGNWDSLYVGDIGSDGVVQ
jgi:hypothetical protein